MKPAEIEMHDRRRPTLERVLIVDDDKSVRESLAEVLVCEGYLVVQAANGEEALQCLDFHHIDVILLDLNMPKLNGWDTFERLSARWPLIPILIVTGRSNQLYLAASAGAAGLLEKPVDIAALIAAVRSAIDDPTSVRLARLAGATVRFDFATPEEEVIPKDR